jgi:hypothetical protein
MADENKTSETQGNVTTGSTDGMSQGKTEISIQAKPIQKNSGFGGMALSEDVANKMNAVSFGIGGQAEVKKDESPDKGKDESKEAGATSEEATKKPVEAEVKGSEFLTAIAPKLEELKLTPEEQQQFITDVLPNWTKFTKANTERAMALKEREKALGDLELVGGMTKFIQTDKVKSALDAIASDKENLDALREVTTDFFDPNGEGKPNPVMDLVDMILSAEPEAEKVTAKQQALDDKETDLQIDDHILQLKGMDKRYLGDEGKAELQATIDLALESGVDLLTAHKIRMGTDSQKTIEDLNAKNKILNDELISVKKQFDEFKKKAPAPADTRNREEKGASDFSVQKDIHIHKDLRSKMNDEMDEATRRIRSKLQVA